MRVFEWFGQKKRNEEHIYTKHAEERKEKIEKETNDMVQSGGEYAYRYSVISIA